MFQHRPAGEPSQKTVPRTSKILRWAVAALLIPATIVLSVCKGLAGAQPHRSFVVAGMCVQPKTWDKAHNFDLLARYAREAANQGARLVVTCEGFLDGYSGNPKFTPDLTRERYLRHGEPIDGPWMKRVGDLAAELEIYLSVGFSERRADLMYNSVAVFSPVGKVVLHYSKTHSKGEPFNVKGSEFPTTDTGLGTLGALICYDRRFPEVPRILALKGAQILIIPAYGTDGERNEALLRTRAWENSVWVVYVKQNQALVIKPNGKIIARDSGEGDQLVFARIEVDDQVGTGDILARRSPEFYRELIELEAAVPVQGPQEAFLSGSARPFYGTVDDWNRRFFGEHAAKTYGRRGQRQMLDIQEKRVAATVEYCERLLIDHPEDLESLFNLTVAYCQLEAPDQAWQSAKRALDTGLPLERFLAGPRELLAPLYESPEFRRLVDRVDARLIHGPMVGCVTPDSAKFWVRTTSASKVEVVVNRTGNTGHPSCSGTAVTDPGRDHTAVVEVRGLEPATAYTYRILIDDRPVPGKQPFKFRTHVPSGKPSHFQVGFGGGALYTPANERMWDTIAGRRLSAFFFLGDNVYIDLPEQAGPLHRYTYYRRQSRPEFRRLVSATPITAIWDDHDCAVDDCFLGPFVDKPAWKLSMWELFRMNWNNPARGSEPDRPGCWFRLAIGEVDFFFLDGRFYRTDPGRVDATMLGPVQKSWLLAELVRSAATFKVIVSPVAFSYGAKDSPDTWNGYRRERDEIFGFLTNNRIDGVVLMSADRHRSDAWRIDRPNDYPLYEFQSSCLTHMQYNFADLKPGALFGYNQRCSFGLLAFDTTTSDPEVTYKVVNIDDQVVHRLRVTRSQLSSR